MRRLMHNIAHRHRATLIQSDNWVKRRNQADDPLCNDEALTSGSERFASSSTNLDRVTHDLGLGKAIVVRLPAQSSHIPAPCGRGCVEEIRCSTGMG